MSFVHFDEILELCCEAADWRRKENIDRIGRNAVLAVTERGGLNHPVAMKRKRITVSSKSKSKIPQFT
ncbi:hypothetical protein [Ammoniphilus sp. CFH 90114]|uniref:hypothetical protein n=1 Tax=Ammoniphilus sp. CFH 90114 TaxID=2493665 RepID=UPI00100EC09B|nr:hypothetical protein [Ammoniphilus sp. CFH 90114]RXT15299.1 hypothetical protein EIZ39_03570 [Ammoniphilus sp. CFH 90114]